MSWWTWFHETVDLHFKLSLVALGLWPVTAVMIGAIAHKPMGRIKTGTALVDR